MDSFKSLIIVFALTGLIAFALINFIGTMQVLNNVNNTIIKGTVLSSFNSSINNNLNQFSSSSENYKNITEEEQKNEQNYQGAITLG